ncbi:MAG: preprotein translocase subunit SecG [Acidobacteriota bacterium]|nr:preprotein translocase subunit SecG [Acidobacteriota bacterium]MDE3265928.1 preprotein translocase subunit SecG [Acidobacteriota bacterium]
MLYAVHVTVSLFLVLVVLLQQGKGADLSVFGGGASQAAFGARGAATLLHKLTVGCFVLFILTTLSIGFLQKQDTSSVMSGVGSAMDEVQATEPAEAPASTAPAQETEGAPAEGEGESTETGTGSNNQG